MAVELLDRCDLSPLSSSVIVEGTESVVLLFISPHESLESEGWRFLGKQNGGSLWSQPSDGGKVCTSAPVSSSNLNGEVQ